MLICQYDTLVQNDPCVWGIRYTVAKLLLCVGKSLHLNHSSEAGNRNAETPSATDFTDFISQQNFSTKKV